MIGKDFPGFQSISRNLKIKIFKYLKRFLEFYSFSWYVKGFSVFSSDYKRFSGTSKYFEEFKNKDI